MKIHRWSPWLRRNHAWAPRTVRAIDAFWMPAAVMAAIWFGIDDLNAWIGGGQ